MNEMENIYCCNLLFLLLCSFTIGYEFLSKTKCFTLSVAYSNRKNIYNYDRVPSSVLLTLSCKNKNDTIHIVNGTYLLPSLKRDFCKDKNVSKCTLTSPCQCCSLPPYSRADLGSQMCTKSAGSNLKAVCGGKRGSCSLRVPKITFSKNMCPQLSYNCLGKDRKNRCTSRWIQIAYNCGTELVTTVHQTETELATHVPVIKYTLFKKALTDQATTVHKRETEIATHVPVIKNTLFKKVSELNVQAITTIKSEEFTFAVMITAPASQKGPIIGIMSACGVLIMCSVLVYIIVKSRRKKSYLVRQNANVDAVHLEEHDTNLIISNNVDQLVEYAQVNKAAKRHTNTNNVNNTTAIIQRHGIVNNSRSKQGESSGIPTIDVRNEAGVIIGPADEVTFHVYVDDKENRLSQFKGYKFINVHS